MSCQGSRSPEAPPPLARRLAWTLACLMAAAFWARGAEASEGGASFYLLGSGGPEAAIMPPLKGVYFDNEFFYENATATAGKQFLIGGNLVSGLHVSSPADFVTVLWAPSTNVLGGVFAVGGALAFGDPQRAARPSVQHLEQRFRARLRRPHRAGGPRVEVGRLSSGGQLAGQFSRWRIQSGPARQPGVPPLGRRHLAGRHLA